MRLLLLNVALFAALSTGDSLQILGLQVPKVVDPRLEKVALRCEYDLGGEELYSVKWYKDGYEFYTFMPSMMPPGREYEVEGVKVDVGRSDSRQVVLLGSWQKKRINLGGTYGCEVSVEAPSYSTAFGSKVMSVAVLPRQNPVVDGPNLRSHYDVGDVLKVNCASAPSYPRSNLSFLLNNNEVDESLTTELPSVGPIDGNLVSSSRLALAVKLEREHFPSGNLSLVCRATMPGIPDAEERRTETIVTLAASNQRLAQEPPKSDASAERPSMFFQTFVLAMMTLPPVSLVV